MATLTDVIRMAARSLAAIIGPRDDADLPKREHSRAESLHSGRWRCYVVTSRVSH